MSAASVLIGGIIGSGIFKKPSIIAEGLASPGWILVSWVAAGALALIGSLIFAELGSVYPQAGGQHTYLRESFGPFPGFLYGWTNLLIINAASLAALVGLALGAAMSLAVLAVNRHSMALDSTFLELARLPGLRLLLNSTLRSADDQPRGDYLVRTSFCVKTRSPACSRTT